MVMLPVRKRAGSSGYVYYCIRIESVPYEMRIFQVNTAKYRTVDWVGLELCSGDIDSSVGRE